MTLLDKINALEADNDTLAYWSPRYGKWMPGLTISEVRAMAESHAELIHTAQGLLACGELEGHCSHRTRLDYALGKAMEIETK